MTKRFTLNIKNHIPILHDNQTDNEILILPITSIDSIIKLLNNQEERIQELESQLRQCQATKNDNGRFKVWQVPPIKEGTKIGITTTEVND